MRRNTTRQRQANSSDRVHAGKHQSPRPMAFETLEERRMLAYNITELNLPGGVVSTATAINASGEVVGYSGLVGFPNEAFLYSNGVMQPIFQGVANGINASGQVVGQLANGDACVWSNGVTTDLKFQGTANAISDNGIVVGRFASGDAFEDAFDFSDGQATSLGTLAPDFYNQGSNALAITRAGGITVGWSAYQSGEGLDADIRAFVHYTSDPPSVLHDITPSNEFPITAGATGINDNGQLVGYSNNSSGEDEAFLYNVDTQTTTDLGSLGGVGYGGVSGTNSAAYGINLAGYVVGSSYTPAGAEHAFWYQGFGTMLDLNSYVDPSWGGTLNVANGINNSGQIVGVGTLSNGHGIAFLADPVPGYNPIVHQSGSGIIAHQPFSATVDVEDSFGNINSGFNGDVTLGLASGTGTLGGTTTVQAVNGVATFNNLVVGGSGTFSLVASGANLMTSSGSQITVSSPPEVTDVLVDSTSWTPAFLSSLQAMGLGNGHGYSIPVGSTAQFKPLPALDLNQIQIVFSKGVTVQESDLTLVGLNVPHYAFSGFNYNFETDTATWTLASPLGRDNLLLNLDGHTANAVYDSSGNKLDGEWANGSSTYSSGDGAPGGDFTFAFNSLPADANQDGVVNGLDISLISSNWLHSGGVIGDVNTDGVVNGLDIAAIASNWLGHLNAPVYTLATTTTVAASANSVAYGTSVTLTATVSSTYTSNEGNVTFLDNGNSLGSVPVLDGTAVLNSVVLPAGTDVITAVYNDAGGIFLPSSTTVGPNSLINTFAGGGNGGHESIGDGGPATGALLSGPTRSVVDSAGDVFIADTDDDLIREVSHATGVITTIAGNGVAGFGGDNGLAINARLNRPVGLALDASGDLFIADSGNNRIREIKAINGVITASSIITTVVGNGTAGYSGDNIAAVGAELNDPYGVALDPFGNLIIADFDNQRIREVNHATGVITTVAGNGNPGFGGDGNLATAAQLNLPAGVAVDAAGDIFIADALNNRIREVNGSTGKISTVVGSNSSGNTGDGGTAGSALLNNPVDVALDAAGDLFIVDYNNQRVREVNQVTGIITTVAGKGTPGFTGDGGLATAAQLNGPYGVAIDAGGDLFIADEGNNRIREVASGVTVTVSPIATTTTVAAPSAVNSLQPATLVATVASAVTPNEGTVTFLDNGNSIGSSPVGNGAAVLVTFLPIGSDEITAAYSDTGGNFLPSSTTVGATVTVTSFLPGAGSGAGEAAQIDVSASQAATPSADNAAATESTATMPSNATTSSAGFLASTVPSFVSPQPVDHTAVYIGPLDLSKSAAQIDTLMSQHAGYPGQNFARWAISSAAYQAGKAVTNASGTPDGATTAFTEPSSYFIADDLLDTLAAAKRRA